MVLLDLLLGNAPFHKLICYVELYKIIIFSLKLRYIIIVSPLENQERTINLPWVWGRAEALPTHSI